MLRWKSLFGDRLTKGPRRTRRKELRAHRRLASETLEDRRMLAVVTVSNALNVNNGDTSSIAALIGSDGGDGISLYEAIEAANNTANSPVATPDVINFNIAGVGPHVIDVSSGASALPTIVDAVTINGYSQPGSSANTAPIGSAINATLQIVLDGNNLASPGLMIASGGSGSTIQGLNIRDFNGDGVSIASSNSNVVSGNFLGTNAAGTGSDNNSTGVNITGNASGNTIGGTANADRNLISGNSFNGVSIGNGATMNTVQGNFIGLQADGTSALGNTGSGVFINATANGNTVGGTTTAARNVIAANFYGVRLVGVNNTTVSGNYIGLDRTGTSDVGNGFDGVLIEGGATNNTIGGTTPEARNIISGNDNHGVFVLGNNTSGNVVSGNYVGTDLTGTNSLSNSMDGVLIDGGDNNTIGGTASGAGNLISANGRNGVQILADVADSENATGNMVQGNLIGTDSSGMLDLGNSIDGVLLVQADNNIIQLNLISGNNQDGVHLSSGSDGNSLLGNVIGLNFSQVALPNSATGVHIVDASNNTIGSNSDPLNLNVISGNNLEGMLITGSTATGNLVRGNIIGANTFMQPRPNGLDGVEIIDGSNNQIGGTGDGEGNVIAFNTTEGVEVAGTPATGNAIQHNSIFNNGTIGIDLSALAVEGDGSTANDFGVTADDDEGANRLQNFPVFIGSATLLGNSIAFRYRVPTNVANATYPLTVDFYIADSDNQEGQTYLASDTYTAAEAEQDKVAIIPLPPLLTNNSFVATATDAAGNTSEFSAPVQIELPTILGSEPTLIRPNENINIDQVNRYQYIAHSTGKTVVRIDFLHLLGDLDLEVRDENGFLLAEGNTSSADQNFEEVILPMVSQETYFINVIAVGFGDDIGQQYALEVENFPAPDPTGVHLDPNSDSGMMNNDGITADNTPTLFIQTDVLNFVDTNNDGFYSDPDFVGPPANPRDAIHALTADEAQAIADGTPEMDDEDGGIAVEVTLINTTTNQIFTFFADPLVAIFPDVYELTVPEDLPDGTYLISARTKVFDGQSDTEGEPEQAMGRSNASPPLWITIDTAGPIAGSDLDLVTHSDSGMFDDDRVTNKMQPAFTGFTEPNAKVKIFARRVEDDPNDPDFGEPIGIDELVGTGVADGAGLWEVTVEPLTDGKYNFTAEFEDAAGNVSDLQGITAFENSNVNSPIPDNGSLDSIIQINQAIFPGLVGDATMVNRIIDVNVGINIEHPNVADLDVVLISPAGTQLTLTSDNGGNGDNYTDTLFDDAAGVFIDNAALAEAPFTGSFRPELGLFNLRGESPFGQWTLSVTDDTGNDLSGQLVSWTLELHIPLMVVIDTVAPNTPLLNVVDAYHGIVRNNMPTVTMTTTDPNIAASQLLWQDNLKFRIYDRYDNTAEFLLYDSALDTAVDAVNSFGDMFTSLTLIEEMLPQQYFNQFGTNDAVIDVNGVGKLADGVHNLKLEVEDRAGNISEDFLLQITVDTSPLLGTWAAGEIVLGPSSNSFAHGLHGYGHGGTTHLIGTDLDYIFAGKFLAEYVDQNPDEVQAAGAFIPANLPYDTLAAYGRIREGGSFVYRWLIDRNGNGYIDPATEIFEEPAGQGFIGVPVAGNFDGDLQNGDEVGLFTGSRWYLDTDGDFNVTDETPINANYAGYPIVGDFDGDGDEDLATYNATSTGGNLFYVDLDDPFGPFGPLDGVADYSFNIGSSFSAGIGFSGTRERPVSADFNADGIDDFGLWVPDGINPVPNELSEWYLFLSGDDPSTAALETTVLDRILDGPLNGYLPFAPALDIYAQHGNTFALPVVGRFVPRGFNLELNDEQQAFNADEVVEEQDVPLAVQVEAAVQNEPVANVETAPPVEEVSPITPPAQSPAPLDTVVAPEVVEEAEVVETIAKTAPEQEDPTVESDVEETPASEEKVETEIQEDTPTEEAPVVPINTTTNRRSFRRSRSIRYSRSVSAATNPAPVEVTIPNPAPIVEVEQPTETLVVEVPTAPEPGSIPAAVEPALETVVIVTPETPPVVEQPAPTPAETEALETAFAEVTSLELSKPDAEPDEELAAEQAFVWQQEQTSSTGRRRFRRGRHVR